MEMRWWREAGSLVVIGGVLGCQPKEVTVDFEQPGCEDYSFSDPAEEEFSLEISEDGSGTIVATHTNMLSGCDTVFEPEVLVEDKVIIVREYWLEGSGTDCETCFSPVVTLEGVPRGRYELRWFIGDEDYPVLVEEFRVK